MWLAILVLVGCDPVATPEYTGERLARLLGTISSELSGPPPDAEIVLLWVNWRTEPSTVLGSKNEVRGSFPAGFDLSLYGPPPAGGMNALPRKSAQLEEPRLGFAWIVVLRKGATPPDGSLITHADIKGLSRGDVLGWAEDFVLTYVDGPAPAGGWAAEVLGAARGPGFRLMRASGKGGADLDELRNCKLSGQACSIEGLSPDLGGDQTRIQVRLTDRLEELRVPVFALPSAVEAAFGI